MVVSRWSMVAVLLGAALAASIPSPRLLAAAPHPGTSPDIESIVQALRRNAVYIDPAVDRFVDARRLRRATAIASRAADAAMVRLAFLNVADMELDRVRDRLFEALDPEALVVATPVSIALRTRTLRPSAEQAIVEADGAALRFPPRDYTAALSELVFDTGLVIHNSRPGAVPRGSGVNRDLRTFSGQFEGERANPGRPWWPILLLAAVVCTSIAFVRARRRRRARGAR
jgi:hypothetical protein